MLNASFSVRSVSYQRKVGGSFFPELLVGEQRSNEFVGVWSTHLHLVPRLRMRELYRCSSIRLHGVMRITLALPGVVWSQ
jgi:hypothetical protein